MSTLAVYQDPPTPTPEQGVGGELYKMEIPGPMPRDANILTWGWDMGNCIYFL